MREPCAIVNNVPICRKSETYTLAHQVRVDLLLEGCLVEITRSNSDTEGNGLLLGIAGHILPDGDGRVDTLASLEQAADGPAGSLGGNEDDINVRRNLDLGEILEDRRETVREVQGLALELGLDGGPSLGLSSVGEEVHDDGTLGDGLINIEQVLARDPAVLDGLLPGSTVLADTDDDVKAIVAEVETLPVTYDAMSETQFFKWRQLRKQLTLGAVADQRKSIVLEVVLRALY